MGRLLTSYGFAVLVPMRRGRGASDGSMVEPDTCNSGDQPRGLTNAIEDLDAVIAYAKTLPYIDMSKVVLEGISRGGLLSIVYASKRSDLQVKGIINFVGGWTSEECDARFTITQFREAGTNGKAPSLWIYGENDRLWSNESIRSYARAFDKGDGNLIFRLYPVPGDGHSVPMHANLWLAELHQFLERIGFQKSN